MVAFWMLGGVFLMEEVQDGEALGLPGDDVAEQRGQQEAQPHLGVVAEHRDQLVGKVAQRYIIIMGIDEPPLELE